ncbi:MAG: hypothetical protein FJW96_05290, partial [Actinobacteria bacterium]|nr:hypothetical protein [Actinomycetota bacterium]
MSALVVAHGAAGLEAGGGSSLYGVASEHVPALVAALATPVVALSLRLLGASGRGRAARLLAGYRALPVPERFAAWMLAASALAHLGLVAGHGGSARTLLFLADALLLGGTAVRLVAGRPWRLLGGLVLTASLLAYGVVHLGGEAPDQVGLATKLLELGALAVVVSPAGGTRRRRLAGSSAVVVLVVGVGISAWAGAFQAAEAGGGHHGG